MTTMLVVARYNEDVQWTREFDRKIIYNKGDRNTIPEDLQHCVIDLPNVGREAHTILHHIIENYDTLDELTIFAQGSYKEHYFSVPADRFKRWFERTDCGHSINFMNTDRWNEGRRSYDFSLKSWGGRELGHNDLKYGSWFESVFSEPYVDSPFAYAFSIFSVDNQHIHRRPKEFYEALIKHLDYHNSPVEAHFMERSWLQVFKINGNNFGINTFLERP